VLPRPIACVVSWEAQQRLNAAPFSFFNVFAPDPPVVILGLGARADGTPKDTTRNIRDCGAFAVNLVSHENQGNRLSEVGSSGAAENAIRSRPHAWRLRQWPHPLSRRYWTIFRL
jgi:flavin reductase (DIM6/NTAB) family NADH-FMN oxidoreductase RutF